MESQEHIRTINIIAERNRGSRAINAAEDENYGEILKSGDNTLLKYKIFDGDGENLPLEGLPCEAVIKKEDKIIYRTPADVDAENIVSFKITEVLPSDRNNPYTIEFIITQGQDTLIFPSDDRINLYIYPSSLSVDGEIIEQTPESRLNEIVIVAVNDAAQEINLGIDNIRNTLESEFEANEAGRRQEFESNEADRQQEFEANEAVRQSQEESREVAENRREEVIGSFSGRLDVLDKKVAQNAIIMGVEWDKQSDPTLTRIRGSKDFVANIGIGDEVVQNDFDYAPIYREIQREVDMYGNVFVRVPRFYIRKTVTDSLKRIEISTEKLKGFYLPAIFYDFENQKELPYAHIGAYNAGISLDGTKLESKAGVKPLVRRNIVDFRSLARDNGKGYQQLDIHAIDVIQALFYVEFATLNSQSIHLGYTSGNTESLASGFSDGVAASSGALGMSATDGFVYRGIENPWGNVYQWIDGVNISDRQAWVCKDAENYASNVFVAPYEKLGYVNHPENGMVKDMGFDPAHPYAEFPVEIGGNNTTNFADYYYQNTGQRAALFGGSWSDGSAAGLSSWNLYDGSSSVISSAGCRLLKKTL